MLSSEHARTVAPIDLQKLGLPAQDSLKIKPDKILSSMLGGPPFLEELLAITRCPGRESVSSVGLPLIV